MRKYIALGFLIALVIGATSSPTYTRLLKIFNSDNSASVEWDYADALAFDDYVDGSITGTFTATGAVNGASFLLGGTADKGVTLSGTYARLSYDDTSRVEVRDDSAFITLNTLEYEFRNASFAAYVDNANTLGTAAKRWSTIYGVDGDFSGALKIADVTTTPSTPTDGAIMWAMDGEMYMTSDGGVTTRQTSHNDRSGDTVLESFANDEIAGPWSFTSRNEITGIETVWDMAQVALEVEKLTGKTLHYDRQFREPVKPTEWQAAKVAAAKQEILNADPWVAVEVSGKQIPAKYFESVAITESTTKTVTVDYLDAEAGEIKTRQEIETVAIDTGKSRKQLKAEYKFEDGKLWRQRDISEIADIEAPELPEWISDRVDAVAEAPGRVTSK